MRLLYCYIGSPSDGSRIHIDSFIKAWREAGDELIVFGVDIDPYDGNKDNWSVWQRMKVRGRWYWNNIAYCSRLIIKALRTRPDVVLFRFDPMHRLFVSIIGVSVIAPVVLEVNAVRSIEGASGRPRVSDWLDKLSINRAARLFVVSDRLKSHLHDFYEIPLSRIAVIENGVDESLFSPAVDGKARRDSLAGTDRFLVGFVGSFRPWHGVGLLIDLAEYVAQGQPEVLFVLIGDGGERQLHERSAQQRGLAEYVRFIGHVPHTEIPEYLAAMDVLIYPMPEAGFKNGFYGSALKIFEYMAMGKVVITSPMGQLMTLVEDGISGVLVPAENLEEIARRIRLLRDSDVLRRQIGERARQVVVEKYTWGVNAEKVRRLCEEAMDA